ncbi:MAG: NUDIX hydrolase [Dermatophilaceae bacterium]
MSLAAPRLDPAQVADRFGSRPVLAHEMLHAGMVFDMVADCIDLGDGGVVTREYLEHPGAVVIVALRGEPGAEEIALIQQYRHPMAVTEWEFPAGLLDVDGEPPWEAARRELAEEIDVRAGRWDVLADYVASPGGMGEALRIYLARDLTPVPSDELHEREAEEVGMPIGWLDLGDALDVALSGRVNNSALLIGIFAGHAARARGWASLRAYDCPWPQHPTYRPGGMRA